MEELYFDKLGNFTEKDCKNIKNMMDGSTFYNYSVGWSNWASNCSLVVKADCGDGDKERAKKMFLYAAISKGASAFNLADFNLLDAHGVISKDERNNFIGRVRTMASAVARLYVAQREEMGFPLFLF